MITTKWNQPNKLKINRYQKICFEKGHCAPDQIQDKICHAVTTCQGAPTCAIEPLKFQVELNVYCQPFLKKTRKIPALTKVTNCCTSVPAWQREGLSNRDWIRWWMRLAQFHTMPGKLTKLALKSVLRTWSFYIFSLQNQMTEYQASCPVAMV